ncbi:hypothetical protein O1B78_003594 [Vibrio cholerae]|nr:hypothetical protein [Vibrio cholerae]RBM36835.1 hypothetical protein DLR62_16010 [Vibrio tarriae]EJK2994597.1 hypothetical protein [Vibrio cholerae]EJL6553628.1 hypothetical protein [Vibrio cholerae]EJL6905752.1 hypothetical protein [Vibrio cholerae]
MVLDVCLCDTFA